MEQAPPPADAVVSELLSAITTGDDKITRQLLSKHKIDLNRQQGELELPLVKAVRLGHEHLVTLLLEHKADVNVALRESGITPLMSAAITNNPTLINILIQRGATVDSRDRVGDSALDKAAMFGHAEAATALLHHNAAWPAADGNARRQAARVFLNDLEQRQCLLALLLGTHPRLGEKSALRQFQTDPLFEKRLLPLLATFYRASAAAPAAAVADPPAAALEHPPAEEAPDDQPQGSPPSKLPG